MEVSEGSSYGSLGRTCHQKRLRFQSVWDGGIFHCTNSGKKLKHTCLERGPYLSGKGLLRYLCLELENNK